MARRRNSVINIADAKARLSELVERAAGGEDIVISRNGRPQVRLVAIGPTRRRVPGRGAGQWDIAADFNDPLPADLQIAAGRARK
jgi:prevent-host-death family protein